MRKQLISFAQIIKFFKISSSGGLTLTLPLRTPLVHNQISTTHANQIS